MTELKKSRGYVNFSGWSEFMNKKIIFCLIVTFLLTNITTAADRYVPTGPFPTIQSGISASNPGDTVFIYDGTYTGSMNRNLNFGGKGITVESDSGNPENCIIDCQNNGRAFYFHNGETTASVVKGITIKNGYGYYGGAIECEDASPTIDNCIITDSNAVYGGAIDCFYASPVIINCIITGNISYYDGGAIECSSESSPDIINCLITDNSSLNGYGGAIDCYDASSPQILNCTIANNIGSSNYGGVYASYASSPTVRNSILWNNGNNIDGAATTNSCVQGGYGDPNVNMNISSNPLFITGPLGDYYLSQTAAGQLADSNCIDAGDSNYTAIFGPSFITRTDEVNDVDTVDMGYHYLKSGSVANCVLITVFDPNGNPGTVVPDPNLALYKQFSEVLITAEPNDPNDYIEKWTIDGNDIYDANTIRFIVMDANHNVSVKFTSTIIYELTTFAVDSNGSIDIYTAQPFVKDTVVDVNAYPNPGYVVRQWLQGTTGIFDINTPGTYIAIDPNTLGDPNILSVTLDANDTTAAVEFKTNPITYMLETRVDGGNGLISPRRGYLPAGMIVQLTATPDPGYRVKQWQIETFSPYVSTIIPGPNTIYEITIEQDTTVTVEFEAVPQYYLTVEVNEPNLGGSISPASGWYDVNSTVTLLATPAPGHHVQGWTGLDPNLGDQNNVNTTTVVMDANNKTVTVTFAENVYNKFIDVYGDVPGIQAAIDEAVNGDTIRIHAGTYMGTGFNIDKAITIVGDPEHPENVVIDCQQDDRSRRGFILIGDSGLPCTLNGVTIINSHNHAPVPFVAQDPTDPLQVAPGTPGRDGEDRYGAAILIMGNHTVKNCIVRDCSVIIDHATDGIPGGDPNELVDPDSEPDDPANDENGGNGGNGGNAGGAGIYVWYGNPNIQKVLIEDCIVYAGDAGNGAQGFSEQEDWTDLDADYFAPGTSGYGGNGGDARGAGIYIASGNPILTDVTVKNCIAAAGNGGNGADGAEDASGSDGGVPGQAVGAGIYYEPNSTLVASNCRVENCKAYGGLGGNGGNAGDIIIGEEPPPPVGGVESGISHNAGYGGLTTKTGAGQGDIRLYSARGGGVDCNDNSNVSFTNCTFAGNMTYGSISGKGGLDQPYEYRQHPLENYLVPSFGAGVFCSTNTTSAFDDCLFENNRTAYNQDFFEPGYRDIVDINDINTISDYGGEHTGAGGGLCLLSANTATVNDCNFILNSAPAGGGIYSDLCDGLHISDSTLTTNIAYAGGGILVMDSNLATVNNSRINGNVAGTVTGSLPDTGYALFGTGGGIYTLGTVIDINDTIITENYARTTGGGICFDGDTDPLLPQVTMKNCLVTKNKAVESGGGIASIYFAEPVIQNCTIANNLATNANSAGGGLFGSYASQTTVRDTIFWTNSGVNGSQIALSDGGPFTDMPAELIITYSDIDLSYTSGLDSIPSESGSSSTSPSSIILVDSAAIYEQINSTGEAKVIVTLDEPTTPVDWSSPASVSAMQSEIATLQIQVLSTLSAGEFTLKNQLANIAVFSGQITQAGLNKLLANPMVAHIEPVRTFYPMLAQGLPLMNALATRTTFNGQGISIAIVDSGVDYTHPMLGGGGFPNSKVIGGYDTGENDADPMPVGEAHGTCCAGLAAGSLGTVGDYIGGVACNAKIYALKASFDDSGYFFDDDILAAWDWCLSHKNDDPQNPILTISNSLGGEKYSSAEDADRDYPAYVKAVRKLVAAEITILAASGNEHYTDGIAVPAAMSDVISIGAVDDITDEVLNYSNTGNILDILAPSEQAYTTDITGTDGYSTGDYYPYFNGTSAACPYAAGAVAALQSAAKQILGGPLSPSQIKNILTTTGDPITDTKVAITKPRVNLGAAIALLAKSVPVFTEADCTITGLEQDANDTWTLSTGRNNISDNPKFVSQDPNFAPGYYYLSHIEAYQDYNSPCFDIGSDTAANLGLDTYTTRVDGVNDVNIVDLGYHYTEGLLSYELQVDVNSGTGIIEGWGAGGTRYPYANTIVKLHALPGPDYRVAMWTLDGEKDPTHDRNYLVLMDGPHSIKVDFEFYVPKTIIVPDEYGTIQEAINAAGDGDTIYVYRKPDGKPHNINYTANPDGLDFQGKSITIRSENPDDPNIVAATVIDCNNQGRAFIFQNNEDANNIIDGLTIINCSVAGAIAMGVQPDPIDPNVFHGIDASGDGFGGAIYCDTNTSPLIRNCVFINCEVTGGRGSDGHNGYDLSQIDPRLRGGNGGNGGNGYGNGYGSFIFCNQESSPTILNCIISNCNARGGIGGNGGDGGDGTTSKIAGDGGNGGIGSGRGYGGAIYCKADAEPKIIHCNFSDSTASMGLGGIGGLRGTGQITDDPPHAYDGRNGLSNGAGFGGVIYYETNAIVDINDCNFIDNTVAADNTGTYDTGGGAIYCEPNCAGTTIFKTNFSNNSTTRGSGGAIVFGADNHVTLTDCFFGGNTANGDGGALAIGDQDDTETCTLDFTRCVFTDNTAGKIGGAIMARNFDANFVDCYINRNTASSGGGLHLVAQSTAKIHGGTIMQNKAIGENAEGGGAYISKMPIEIINCQITGNTSLYNAAGLMLKGPETNTSLIHNCLFADNFANTRGGALFTSLNTSPTITSCTFSKNGAGPGGMGGGVLCDYNSSPIIQDCIFDQTRRVAVYENNLNSNPSISYCLFYDNFDGDFYDRDSGITYKTLDVNNPDVNLAALNNATDGNNVAGTDSSLTPLFAAVPGPLGKYYLSQPLAANPNIVKSPAVDMGSNDANKIPVLPDANMADYTTRIDSDDPNIDAGDAGRLDIGFHYVDPDSDWPKKFMLTTNVVGGYGTIEPSSGLYYAGTTVEITALPEPGWRVDKWTGTDDDSSTSATNYVVMISKRNVTVSFGQPRNLYVPSEYSSLQEAVNDAKDNDKIILAQGTYYGSEANYDPSKIMITGRNFTITSTNPDDPCVVAQTVLLGNGFRFRDVGRNMILDGITIESAHYWPGVDIDCGDPEAHSSSGDGRNGVGYSGGAINLINASPTVRNCRFIDCSATGQEGCEGSGEEGDGGWAGWARGGAVNIDTTSNPIFKNCQFMDCFVQPSNGMDGSDPRGHGGNWGDPDGGYVTWDFGPYEPYWYYSGYGGAIYCMGGSKPEFEKCLFQGNRAYGGVCGISGSDNIAGYPMENYAIDSFGGAVYLAAGSQATFTDCNFTDNLADTRNQIGDANITYEGINNEFVLHDPVVSYGGAVCAEGTAIPVFKNCTFTDNIACAGGGTYWEDSIAHISRSNFNGNVSMLGGGVLLIDSNSILFECNFSNNQAIEPAGQGGAIYCASSAAKFYDCKITDNEALASGGGAYFTGELEPNMHNCLVTDNIAGRDGGGISSNWDVQLGLSNCTVTKNTATGSGFQGAFGGGLSCAYEANTKIINSIFWNNNATYGPEISIGNNFDASDKLRAEVTVSYSDIKGGAANVYVDADNGCLLNWVYNTNLEGTSLASPLFVTGPWGGFYLSQIDTNEPLQTADSPCVDSGFETAINNDMYRHTTRTDSVIDIANSYVDMGYHYTLIADILGDFNFDGVVDMADLDMFMDPWWMQSNCTFPYFCHERDMTEDGEVDYEDFAMFAANYGETETTPPKPDPMTWEKVPQSAVGLHSITMTATKAVDLSGSSIKYYFDCFDCNDGDCNDHHSGWISSSTYINTGLIEGERYGYQVKARDERFNETGWSTLAYATPGKDTSPPDPSPMKWASELEKPHAISSSSIRMTAKTATDDTPPVYYYFECTTDGDANSGWQTDPNYTATGLSPETQYTFRVKARDNTAAHYETQYSVSAFAITPEEGVEPNEPNEPTGDITPPTYTPTAYGLWVTPPNVYEEYPYYYHNMVAVTATDAESPPVTYYFDCVDGGGTDFTSESPIYNAGPYIGENRAAYQVHIRNAVGLEVVSSTWDTQFGFIE